MSVPRKTTRFSRFAPSSRAVVRQSEDLVILLTENTAPRVLLLLPHPPSLPVLFLPVPQDGDLFTASYLCCSHLSVSRLGIYLSFFFSCNGSRRRVKAPPSAARQVWLWLWSPTAGTNVEKVLGWCGLCLFIVV